MGGLLSNLRGAILRVSRVRKPHIATLKMRSGFPPCFGQSYFHAAYCTNIFEGSVLKEEEETDSHDNHIITERTYIYVGGSR